MRSPRPLALLLSFIVAKLPPGSWHGSRSIFRVSENFIRNRGKLLIVRSIYLLLERGDSGVTLSRPRFGAFTQSSEWVSGTQPCFLDSRWVRPCGRSQGVAWRTSWSLHTQNQEDLYNSSFTRDFIENLTNTWKSGLVSSWKLMNLGWGGGKEVAVRQKAACEPES